MTRDDLRGRIAHLILAGGASVERVAQLAARSFDTVVVVIPLEDVTSTAARRTVPSSRKRWRCSVART